MGPSSGLRLCGDWLANGTNDPLPGPLPEVGGCLRWGPFRTVADGEELWLLRDPRDDREDGLAGNALTPLLDEVICNELCSSDDISWGIFTNWQWQEERDHTARHAWPDAAQHRPNQIDSSAGSR